MSFELPPEILASLDAENQRRVEHEKRHSARQARLSEEAEQAQINEATMSMKWAAVSKFELPEELLDSLKQQQAECERIIGGKDDLIRMLQSEVSLKDDEYTRALLLQEKEITALLSTMRENYATLRSSREKELVDVESQLDKERTQLLDSLHSEMEKVFDQRRKLEEHIVQSREVNRNNDTDLLRNLRIQQAEDLHSLRMKYWSDLQHQDREIEQMRATYLLNIERLEFNHAALTQHSLDSEALLSSQKRKQSKMRDVLSRLKKTYYQEELQFRTKAMKNMEVFKRITNDYKELQRKLHHFELNDFGKFKKLFLHYEEKSRELLTKCFEIDRFIFETELGLESPELEIPIIRDYNPKQGLLKSQKMTWIRVKKSRNWTLVDVFLKILDDETKFLVPDDSLSFHDRIATVLGLLKIRTSDQLFELINYFKKSWPNLSDIDSSSVLSAVLSFLNEASHNFEVNKPLKEMVSSESYSVHSESKTKKNSNMPDFDSFIKALPPSHVRVWKALNKGLVNYKQVLTERLEVLDHTDELRRQNEELKALLNNYLRAQINDELIVPPTNVIKFG
ncbi:hypothetical protein GEMRC1_010649 [Eukaryota sp. GEM-RC1]